MEVLAIEKKWFFYYIKFYATKYEEVVCETMLGDKMFYVEEGEVIELRMNKNNILIPGDEIPISSLITEKNQHQFKWEWINE